MWRGGHSPYESAATQMRRVHLQSRTPDMVEFPDGKSQLYQLPVVDGSGCGAQRAVAAVSDLRRAEGEIF